MMRLPARARRTAAWLGFAALTAAPLQAQEDFRNLDLGRPLRVEDAEPLELREWELVVGARGRLLESGPNEAAAELELTAGLLPNTQLGVGLETALRGSDAGARGGIESLALHVLHGLRRETPALPGVALRGQLGTPGAGEVGHEDWTGAVRGIATRSLGRWRVHANGGYRVAADADGGETWLAGVAVDYPIGLFSRMVMADLFAEIPVEPGRTRLWLEVGTRWQTSNRTVLDLGLSTRLDEWERGRTNLELTLGFSRASGLAGLVAVPDYPEPRID